MTHRYLVFLVLLLLAQSCTRIVLRSENTELASKPVVVRLATSGKKIRFLKEKIRTLENNSGQTQKYVKLLDRTIKEDKAYTELILTAFREDFTCCPVYFIPDSLWTDFKKGAQNVCLDREGKTDPGITAPADYLLISATGPREKLVMTDKDDQILPPPLPHRKNVFFPSFRRLANKRKYIASQVSYFNHKMSIAKL